MTKNRYRQAFGQPGQGCEGSTDLLIVPAVERGREMRHQRIDNDHLRMRLQDRVAQDLDVVGDCQAAVHTPRCKWMKCTFPVSALAAVRRGVNIRTRCLRLS